MIRDGKRKTYEKPTLVKAGTLINAADLAANGAGSGPIYSVPNPKFV